MLSVTSLTLSPSVLTACTTYNITDDLIKEEDELFSLQLTSMANTVVIPEPMLNITITSADGELFILMCNGFGNIIIICFFGL